MLFAMRRLVLSPVKQSIRFFKKNAFRLPDEGLDPRRRETYARTPGYFTAALWHTQRTENEKVFNLSFPTHDAPSSGNQTDHISSGVAHISGKPVDDNISYDTFTNFSDLKVDQKLLANVASMKLSRLTPVQMHAIPLLMKNPDDLNSQESRLNVGSIDLMASAQTGSGKTLAYLLPMLNRIMCTYPADAMDSLVANNFELQYPSALIIAPTRELVHQIRMVATMLCYRSYVRPVGLFGGEKPERQANELQRGCHVAIATPGRLLDFLDRQFLKLTHCRTLIIDEADRMLDMGFEPQLRKILESRVFEMPSSKDCLRQTALFSATFPRNVALLARDFLRGSCCVSLNVVPEAAIMNTKEARSHLVVPVWGEAVRRRSSDEAFKQLKACVPREILQRVVWLDNDAPIEMLKKLTTEINQITEDDSKKTGNDCCRVLVFCNTKREADRVDRYLSRQNLRSVCVHGDRSQQQRTAGVDMFRKGHANVLVATSVAARGLDFPSIRAVFNYGLPLGLDDYVHRIGRTGRMGQNGLAVTMAGPMQLLGDSEHMQQIARGICRLITGSSANGADGIAEELLPPAFLKAACWHQGSLAETEDDTTVQRNYQRQPKRLGGYQPKRFPPRRNWS